MNFAKLSIYALVVLSMATPTSVLAHWWDDYDEEEEKIPLEEAELFFELNDTDGDLGIHGFADGDAWKELEIEGPNGRELLKINAKSKLKRQGVTELFFESAEPIFDELSPAKFFKRFPEGVYEIEVELLDGGERESEVYLSHIIPAAPDGVTVMGIDEGIVYAAAENCDAVLPVVDPTGGVVISWNAVTMSHATLGTSGVNIADDVISYEFIAEIDETPFDSATIVKADVTEWTIPEEFIDLLNGLVDEDGEPIEEIKFEILVRVDNGFDNPGNKSAVESCFEVD